MSRIMNSRNGRRSSDSGGSGRKSFARSDFNKRSAGRGEFDKRRSDSRDFDKRSGGREFNRDHSGGRDRRPSGYGNRRDIELTEVICDSCGKKCEVPFKPTSNKPVYCRDCFSKKDNGDYNRHSSDKHSDRDIDVINEKLNKIMKALNIK